MYKQEPPFAVQIELTEGCNLRCSFCGLNGIRGKDNNFKFLTVELAERIVELLKLDGWKPRLEFAMHGEPTANPDMLDILKTFRRKLPKGIHMMMTSNGMGFMKDPSMIDEALKYLNVIALDWYENVNIVPRILKTYKGEHRVRRYPQDPEANPHVRRKPNERLFVIVQDISEATKGNHSTLNNHAGSGSPKNRKADGKRCAKPFRELSIRWNGTIAICCNDWRGEYKCGSIVDSTLEEIWQSPQMMAARKKLYHGERDFGPCDGCDALSYRVGFLPDKKGKESLPEANQDDYRVIDEALSGRSLTLPVLREWEK